MTRLGYVDFLKVEKCKTVFAPTDDVFAKLPAGTLDELIENGAGEKILLRHVVNACINSGDIVDGPVETAGGEKITLTKTAEGKVQIKSGDGEYTVTAADVQAKCGVIHIVDGIFV